MKFPLIFLSACLLPGLAVADWDVRRFEGRDYVTVDSLATFYGFPSPPALLGAKPSVPTLLPVSCPLLPVPLVVPGNAILLDSGKQQLAFALGSREAWINGVRSWLGFPIAMQDGHALISRIDLAKVVEPRLRPDRIEGFTPVETVVLDPGHSGHDLAQFRGWALKRTAR
jgi:N-acetylmuramoyl-L-alanine amidase